MFTRRLLRVNLLSKWHFYDPRCSFSADAGLESSTAGDDTSPEQVTETKSQPERLLNEEDKSRVLDFFNKSDFVTLNKLLNLNKKLCHIKAERVVQCLQFGSAGRRFQDMSDLLRVAQVKEDDLCKLSDGIEDFKKSELSHLGVTVQPRFKQSSEKIKKVVAIDVFQRHVAWSEQYPHNRVVTQLGYEQMFPDNFDFKYHHIIHHNEVSRVIQKIPDADVYLLHNYTGPIPKGKNVKYGMHQSIVQAIFITLLNSRLHPAHYAGPDQTSPGIDPEKQENSEQVNNSVYLFDRKSIGRFHGNMLGGELKMLCSEFLSTHLGAVDGPLSGLSVSDRFNELLCEEQVATCTVMSDIFCRCLNKRGKSFPQMYS